MNSRRYFEIMPSEGEKKFTLPVNEHQVIFQRYLDMTYHVQELDQLYRMMLYILKKFFGIMIYYLMTGYILITGRKWMCFRSML